MTTTIPNASDLVRAVTCPACGHHVAVPVSEGGLAPLVTLAWAESADEARALGPLPLDFVRCVECGHVFNAAFDYAAVPLELFGANPIGAMAFMSATRSLVPALVSTETATTRTPC